MFYWRSLSVLACAGLLSACAPGHLYVEEGVLEGIDHRIQTQNEHLQGIQAQQSQSLSSILEAQESVVTRLQETIFERVKPPECKPEPKLVCPPQGESGTLVLGGLEKQLVGEIEQVHLSGLDATLPARIDTGATTSSLDARNIQFFERDGRRWVRFDFVHPATGDDTNVERPVVRVVRISQSISEDYERRPVVELRFTLGNVSQSAEFTLTDRSHLDFPVLIGRNILKDMMVVDVGKQNIAPPQLPNSRDNRS
ncbi:ATP-dependent zinc protease family protein [Nitrincola tapanii]|uniref:Retropepsin-like aspartic endopeptidase domain-containing protein n=1 Tax=Nitrincola tapanii TaxID=1708751 RepID=A0A5A9W6D1_9GAMM|nr:RimK/LysX family protein [Nitrincola tapanii]KAA0875678.1 hypothetical protein E1H14_02985 [Nitrincola tapanii]